MKNLAFRKFNYCFLVLVLFSCGTTVGEEKLGFCRTDVHSQNKSLRAGQLEQGFSISKKKLLRDSFYRELVEDLAGKGAQNVERFLSEDNRCRYFIAPSAKNWQMGAIHSLGESANENYSVTFQNQTDEILSEVVIFWQSKDGIMHPPIKVFDLVPNQIHFFDLGACENMWRYKIGVFLGGMPLLKIPPGEGQHITPDVASGFNPNDHYPCQDTWGGGVSVGPKLGVISDFLLEPLSGILRAPCWPTARPSRVEPLRSAIWARHTASPRPKILAISRICLRFCTCGPPRAEPNSRRSLGSTRLGCAVTR